MGADTDTKSTIAYDQRLARWVARPLARTPVSPNLITFLGLVMGLCAAWLFSRGDTTAANWGAVLFVAAAWADPLDGELARASGKTSKFGHYFDHAAMVTTYVTLFVGMGVGLATRGMGDAAMLLGIASGVAVGAIFGTRVWIENRLGREAVAMTPVAGFEVEDILYIVAPITWLGLLDFFLIAAGIGAPLFLMWTAWETSRAMRAKNARSPAP